MLASFSDRDLLFVWERALDQHPVDRGLSILAAALPEAGRDRLAALSVGQRDGHLMDVHEANFGSEVSGVAECPECGEPLEWSLHLDDIRIVREDEGGPSRLTVEEYELSYRLPDSTDLAAVAQGGDVQSGRAVLLRRCVLEARKNGAPVERASLPDPVVQELASRIEARDPQAEILLDFGCPACGLRWQGLFDVAEFLWAEIHARARRLLNEVHGLAQAYGWAEEDILKMSAARRRFYLEAAT